MLGRVKKFIRRKLDNEDHPAIHEWYRARDERKRQQWEKRRANMTYAEIEAEINRMYEAMFGRKLDWDNPKTYNEKLHVSKIYMATPEKTRLADKYLVREWIREKIGGQYSIPLLGVYDSFDEIDFDALPSEFVIKCNHDSGSVTLVKDKGTIDREALREKYGRALATNYAYVGHEMYYRDIKPKILIEQYMGDAINDYKFLCFDGKPYYCWVDFDRYTNHKRNMYNLKWELQPFNQYHYGNYDEPVPCPECFDEMINIASELCKGFGHVRVDLYNIEGQIYFGEMTFTNGNGFEEITPDEYSYKLGELWPFDNTIRKKILATRTKP